ncbi:MAG: phospholipase D family protein [Ardenticatenaceae bacterium]|nr:phospholipase D family protein [Ardenticatenaceae bacterium]
MKILLQPNVSEATTSLQNLYNQAITEAVELFIVNAYLTGWQSKEQITNKCRELTFIVGTDFGLTRREACKKVLKWLPEEYKNDFLAADTFDGFHPKLVMWQDNNGQNKILLGSSNLTQAGFSTNHEVNALLTLSDDQYNEIKKWVYQIRLNCSPISEDWLKQYKEAKSPKHSNGRKKPVISFDLPSGYRINKAIEVRKEKYKTFTDKKDKFSGLIEKCASGTLTNPQFYEKMMELYSTFRLQGRGFEIKGKHGNWQDVCKSLLAIITSGSSSILELDNLVKKKIDHLAKTQNPNRGAWLSEMLCLYFPNQYPLLNKPVKVWLQVNKYRAPHKASEGAKYIDLALKLRQALRQNTKNNAKNLLELDHAIWQWYYDLKNKSETNTSR